MRYLVTSAVCAALSTLAPAPHAATVRLTAATLHAATLTTPRDAADSTDAPYLLVSMLDAHGRATTTQLPEAGHLAIHLDEALGTRPLTDIRVERGDTVRVLVSALEDPVVRPAEERHAAMDAATALGAATERRDAVVRALTPLVRHGAHLLGAVALTLTNDDGGVHWRALECLATCTVSRAPSPEPMAASGAPTAVVVQLDGGGGTYHLQLHAALAP